MTACRAELPDDALSPELRAIVRAAEILHEHHLWLMAQFVGDADAADVRALIATLADEFHRRLSTPDPIGPVLTPRPPEERPLAPEAICDRVLAFLAARRRGEWVSWQEMRPTIGRCTSHDWSTAIQALAKERKIRIAGHGCSASYQLL